MRPRTVTVPGGGATFGSSARDAPCGVHPRLTSTARPSASTSGVIT